MIQQNSILRITILVLGLVTIGLCCHAQRIMAYRGPIKSAPYLASAANNWNPKDPAMMMKWDGRHWVLSVPKAWYGTAYKLTLGSWETVECKANGMDSPNRNLSRKAKLGSKKDTIWLKAAAFKPMRKASTKLPNVLVLEPIWSEYLKRFVTVRVGLPRYYNGLDSLPEHTYTVCYLHDGQNLFDDSTAFAGEWGIDEYLAESSRDLIVVGIDQANDRMSELSPFPNKKYGGGKGDAYLDFITKELKPLIDKQFRTKSDRINTIIGGSSLGGLISYWAMVRPQDKSEPVFGRAVIFSPAIWFNPQVLNYQPHQPAYGSGYLNEIEVYLLSGGKEGSNVTAYTNSLAKRLENAGYTTRNYHDPAGQHKEAFWREHIFWALNSVTYKEKRPRRCGYSRMQHHRRETEE